MKVISRWSCDIDRFTEKYEIKDFVILPTSKSAKKCEIISYLHFI